MQQRMGYAVTFCTEEDGCTRYAQWWIDEERLEEVVERDELTLEALEYQFAPPSPRQHEHDHQRTDC